MSPSFHSLAYRKLKSVLESLTFGVSLGFRIYFSTFLILFTTSTSYVLLYSFQQKQTAITQDILNLRISSMQAAQKIKESVVAYDNAVFRYVATKSESDLLQSKNLKETALREVEKLNTLSQNATIQSRLVFLRSRLRSYFEESNDLVQHARSNKLPPSAGLFQAASWARNQGIQKQELSALSAEGEARLQRVFALCDELLTHNNAELSSARSQLNALSLQSQKWSKIVFWIAFGVVLLISMLLAISLIGPIRILMGGVRQIDAGQLDIELPVTTSTEIGQLTMAFNRMAKTIHEQREQLLRETITDNLTGVYNQRYFSKRLSQEFDRCKRAEEQLSLMMIDLDNFKKYNDTHGHELGNVVLKKVAVAIKENLRNIDLLFRYGGDEFAAVLPNAEAAEAKFIAERLTEVIRTCRFPGTEGGEGLRITLSIGGASYPGNAQSLNDLVEKADQALYLAKDGGRDCFKWSDIQTPAAAG